MVDVVQEDRDAAADQYERSPYEVSRCQGEQARKGHLDSSQLVQAFARHRLATEARLSPAATGAEVLEPTDLERVSLGALHDLQHSDETLIPPVGGASIIAWAVLEMERLRTLRRDSPAATGEGLREACARIVDAFADGQQQMIDEEGPDQGCEDWKKPSNS